MCGGGGKKQQRQQAEAAAQAQEQSIALQREQMEMQRQQMEAQQAQYREQLAISNAPPPPAPNAGAMAPMSAIETMDQTTAQPMRAGTGRRRLRTDRPQATALAIPGAA